MNLYRVEVIHDVGLGDRETLFIAAENISELPSKAADSIIENVELVAMSEYTVQSKAIFSIPRYIS